MNTATEIRELIAELGTSQRGAARILGMSERKMRSFCSEKDENPRAGIVILALKQLIHEKNNNDQ